MGGLFEIQTNVQIGNTSTVNTLAAALAGQFQATTGKQNISAGVNLTFDDTTQNLLTTATGRARILGANPKFTDCRKFLFHFATFFHFCYIFFDFFPSNFRYHQSQSIQLIPQLLSLLSLRGSQHYLTILLL